MASKRAKRRKACTGKVAYATQAAAYAAALSLYRNKGERVQAYRCRYCKKFWHVGHWKRRKKVSA